MFIGLIIFTVRNFVETTPCSVSNSPYTAADYDFLILDLMVSSSIATAEEHPGWLW